VGFLDALDKPLRVLGEIEETKSHGSALLGAGQHVAGRTARIARFANRMRSEAKEGKPPGTAKFLWRLGGLFMGGGD
jgi:hypothetical protein